MKNKFSKNDEFDDFLFDLAKKSYEPVPENIHNTIMNTIKELEKESELSTLNNTTTSSKKRKLPNFSFKEKFNSILTSPLKTVLASTLAIVLVTSSAVCANKISDKIFGKDNLRLNEIGISNEFIFTDEMERALEQNVPLNLIQLNDDYYINVHSILLDEINFFTVFELHCKTGVTDDLRFCIRDLKITDENGNIIYNFDIEGNNYSNKGYKHLYNRENSIKELFFMFGNDNSKIKELNFTFTDIEIYRYDTKLNPDSTFKDIKLKFEEQTINVPITKDNYNTIETYVLESDFSNTDYSIEKVILTKTGLYITAESNIDAIYPIINIGNDTHIPTYNLPLKRIGMNKNLMLYAYNIKTHPDVITIYNQFDNQKYNLIKEKEV